MQKLLNDILKMNLDGSKKENETLIQKLLDNWHKKLQDKKITKEHYVQLLDSMEKKFPVFVKKYWGKRMDVRTFGEWGLTLVKNEPLEKGHADWWFPKYAKGHFPKYKNYECVGISQAGRIVIGGRSTARPDYQINSGEKIEIKDNPSYSKCTYKMDCVDRCIKDETWILTIHGKDRRFYTLLSPATLIKMREASISSRRWEVGGKRAIQFYYDTCKNVENMISKRKISPDALPFEIFEKKHKSS